MSEIKLPTTNLEVINKLRPIPKINGQTREGNADHANVKLCNLKATFIMVTFNKDKYVHVLTMMMHAA